MFSKLASSSRSETFFAQDDNYIRMDNDVPDLKKIRTGLGSMLMQLCVLRRSSKMALIFLCSIAA